MTAEGAVKHVAVNVKRKLLNLSRFRNVFREPFHSHWGFIYDITGGRRLNWGSPHEFQTERIKSCVYSAHAIPTVCWNKSRSTGLRYTLEILTVEVSKISDTGSDKARRWSMVEGPEPVMQVYGYPLWLIR